MVFGSVESEEVFQNLHAAFGGDGFGVELDAPDGEFAVAESHDFAFGGLGGDFEGCGEGGALDEERVVARGGEALGHVAEDVGVFVENRRGLPVHEAVGADDAAAIEVADGLVSEADAEDGFLAGEGADHVEGDAGFGGGAGAGGDEDAVGVEREGFGGRDLVVAEDALFDAQLTEILDEVEGEGIVVVDDEQHGVGRLLSSRVDTWVKRGGVLGVCPSILSF